jgi:RAT1-interacting protein
MSYWGYKFETLSTVSKPPAELNASEKVEIQSRKLASANTNEQYCTVVKTKLGNTTLIMGAEVDCTSGIFKESYSRILPSSRYLRVGGNSTKSIRRQPVTELRRTQNVQADRVISR